MSYSDETLVCRDCGQTFAFTGGEQEFYASHGLLNKPSRCPTCRAARKGGRSDVGASSSSWSGGGSSDGGYRSRAPREMYTVTCSNCGKEAQVPFQPTAGKPVYCSDCYRQVGGSSRSGGGRSYGGYSGSRY